MPVMRCQSDGRPGYKWGESGHCYTYEPGNERSRRDAKRRAYIQGYAINARRASEKVAKIDDADRATVVEIIDGLIDDELEAIDSYDAAADVIPDAHVRDVLEHIRDEEVHHAEELRELLAAVQKDADVRDVHVDAPVGAIAYKPCERKFESDNGSTTVACDTQKSLYVPIAKIDAMKHKVYGIVLSPNEVDLQGDMVTEEEIEKASDMYMTRYQRVGYQHMRSADAVVVQNYIAPVDFMLGSEYVRKGAWVICIKVNDEEIWKDVVEGKITGLSIGGIAKSTPIDSSHI